MNKNTIKKTLFVSFMIIFLFFTQADRFVVKAAETGTLGGSVADCYEDIEKCSDEGNVPDQSKQDAQDTKAKQLDIGFLDVFKMIAALLFVLAILYFLLKFINKKSRSYQYNQTVQNFGGTSLGNNRSVQIVKVGDRLLILGVGEDIRLLKEITDEEELNQYIKQYEEQIDQSLQPRDIISKLVNKKKANDQNIQDRPEQSFQHFLKGQLDEIKKGRKEALNKLEEKEIKRDE